MAGRYPKPAAQRRRRNKVPDSPRLGADPGAGVKPVLPFEAAPATLAWWDAIWASPMSVIWLEADAHGLLRLAALRDAAERGRVGGLVLGEIRQLEDRFGLSPLARRRLQWEVAQATGEVEVPQVEDDGRWLRAVSD